jgi:hypothetical protein
MTAVPISLRRLYVKAKAEKDWRCWGLYVHVGKLETRRAACATAKQNDGAPGIDGVTFEAIEAAGVEYRSLIVDFAARHRLPLRGLRRVGRVVGLRAPDTTHMARRAASYVDKILKAPSPQICRSSSPRSSTWSSISRPPRPSALRSRRRCCCRRTG